MPTFGQVLREVREKHRLSLRHLAARVRITAPYLSDIELGRRYPSERVLTDLARALHTPIDELRRYDPRTVFNEIQKRVRNDPEFGFVLQRLLSKCATTEDLLRIVER